MRFNTLNKDEEKLRYFMAKEQTPIGKILIQQNLISTRLIRLLKHFEYESLEKLKRQTMGRLIKATEHVLPPNKKNLEFIKKLQDYLSLRNELIHNMDSSVYIEKGQNELYHKTKLIKKLGNVVLGKSESIFTKLNIKSE